MQKKQSRTLHTNVKLNCTLLLGLLYRRKADPQTTLVPHGDPTHSSIESHELQRNYGVSPLAAGVIAIDNRDVKEDGLESTWVVCLPRKQPGIKIYYIAGLRTMASRSAAKGLKVVIAPSQAETFYDCPDGGSLPPSSLSINQATLLPSSSSPRPRKSPLAGPSGVDDFRDHLPYNMDTPTPGSSASPQSTVPESSAERALAEFALVEEIRVAQLAIHLFLNNDILEAKRMLEAKVDNMYAAVAHSTILYLQALMTVTAEDARTASKALRETQSLCGKRCRGRFSRSKRTEEQVHAELCYAECGLMLSALVLSEDPGLTALVKAGIRFKSSHSTYQTCLNILRDREWSCPELKGHFESGVRLGIGSFNLIFSCVPAKHAKYLSIVGFSGVSKVGHAALLSGGTLGALRSVLCSLVLIGWETYGKIVLGCGICDVDDATEMLIPLLEQYPNGAIVLFLCGRVAQLKGQFAEALEYFKRSMEAQTEWKQYQHLCVWESMWCHCFTMDYMKASELAYYLYKENQWSKTTYAYLTASFLLMLGLDEATIGGEKVTVSAMMGEVLARKQRVAGQSLPPEKLAEKRFKRYVDQNKDLIFPAFEFIYFTAGMSALVSRPDIVQDLLSLLDGNLAEIKRATSTKDRKRIHVDSIHTINFLRGICLSYLNKVDDACAVLNEIIDSDKSIVDDKFLPPHAAMEIAHLKLRTDDLSGALQYCMKALSFKTYFMQAKLELRIAATMELIEEREEALSGRPPLEKTSSNDAGDFYTPPSSPEPDI
ncbi:Tetratricopeptide repeat protein 39B [Hypsibius exemplaris]|uniref:Tetratricopeptide repeat protein 39B n=1 Tax=Hypsibius exemplaris TaxID=2072580 RepID=A0A1W0X0W1_HYPEX|nr:Tetratricopeptide repeat protein 39B [Hypsibius exemplaris]